MSAQDITLAVVTGGHSYEVPSFHRLFRSLDGIETCVQSMDDFASSSEAVRDGYDVVLFYIMLMEGPSDEGLPWYAGKPKTALEHLGETTQGILVLHHALLAYPKWPLWADLVGIADPSFGYYIGEQVHVGVANADHPVTRGIEPWDMVDETYTMADAGPDSDILLTIDHPKSMKTIAWTRQFKRSRVFCFQSGHDDRTWANASFREVLRRGIHWCAARI